MSFSNTNRSFGQKPVKRKKQDFHTHKIKFSDQAEQRDQTTIKDRTVVSLVHLGSQRFSEGPGAYSLDNWLKSFNLLLDDFEIQMGSQSLPKEYYEERLRLTSFLVQKRNSSASEFDEKSKELNDKAQNLSKKIASLKLIAKLDQEARERKQKITALEEEKGRYVDLLQRANHNLAMKRKQIQDSSKLLRRIFGSSKVADSTPVETLEKRVRDFESKIGIIENKIHEQQKKLSSVNNQGSSETKNESVNDLQIALNSILSELEELEGKKIEHSELLEERMQVTSLMKDVISRIGPNVKDSNIPASEASPKAPIGT